MTGKISTVHIVLVTAMVIMAFGFGYVASELIADGNNGTGDQGTGDQGTGDNGTSDQGTGNDISSKITVMDDMGVMVELDGYPQRIVSLAPSNTEIIYELEVESLLVAVDTASNYPSEVADLPKINTWPSISVEAVIAYEPDLVLAHEIVKSQVAGLRAVGLKVVTLAPNSITDIYTNIRLVGYLTNSSAAAEQLVGELEIRENAITSITVGNTSLLRPTVLYDMGSFYTTGAGTFQNDIILLAGGVNIASATGLEWPQLSKEFILESDPDVILFNSWSDFNTAPPTGMEGLSAVINGKTHLINADTISRTGPRVLDALEELFELIHPELA